MHSSPYIAGPIVVYVGGEMFVRYERIRRQHSFEIHCTQCDWRQTVDTRPGAEFRLQTHAQHCVDAHLAWVRHISKKADVLGVAAFVPGAGFIYRTKDEVTFESTSVSPECAAEIRRTFLEIDTVQGVTFKIEVPMARRA